MEQMNGLAVLQLLIRWGEMLRGRGFSVYVDFDVHPELMRRDAPERSAEAARPIVDARMQVAEQPVLELIKLCKESGVILTDPQRGHGFRTSQVLTEAEAAAVLKLKEALESIETYIQL